jgi:hypothetical protein
MVRSPLRPFCHRWKSLLSSSCFTSYKQSINTNKDTRVRNPTFQMLQSVYLIVRPACDVTFKQPIAHAVYDNGSRLLHCKCYLWARTAVWPLRGPHAGTEPRHTGDYKLRDATEWSTLQWRQRYGFTCHSWAYSCVPSFGTLVSVVSFIMWFWTVKTVDMGACCSLFNHFRNRHSKSEFVPHSKHVASPL